MKLYFVGAAHEVTGSCTILYACGKKIMIDCGMEQGENVYENVELPVSPNDIDAMLLTHAHIDHSGHIPYVSANGFSAPIYTTSATDRLCRIMLMDSAHIQEFEAEWKNRKNKRSGKEPIEPLYTTQDVQNALKYFTPCEYDESYQIFDGIEIKFIDAGHLLGSASIEKADYVIIESTYGNRLHGDRPDYVLQLTGIIQSTLDRGGNVIIPSFAVGRTQELLYLIRIIKEKGLIKNHANFPVWVDSPLAVEATEIYDDKNLRRYFDADTLELINNGINPIKFDNLKLAVTSDESRMINDDPTPKIILSASGMCEAGRIRHHLKHNLWREECTVLFVGYQAEGTLGRKIIEGANKVNLFGEEVQINANIEKMQGISGHADKNMLLSWLASIPQKPKVVFVNHGHDTVCDEFAKSIENELEISALAPYSGDGFELGDVVRQVDIGPRKLYDKKLHKIERNNTVYDRLYLAGQNLMSVIEASRGCPNKELGKLTDQITALIEKYKQD